MAWHSKKRVILSVLAFLLSVACFARHPANIASAQLKVAVDGAFELKVRYDILAYCLDMTPSEVTDPPMYALLDGPASDLDSQVADAKVRFRSHIKVFGDGAPATFDSYSFPSPSDIQKIAAANGRNRLPVMVTVILKGHLPGKSTTSSAQFPESLGEVVLTTEFPYEEPVSEPVEPGSASTELTLPTAKQVAGVESTIQRRAEAEADPTPTNPPPAVTVDPRKSFAAAHASVHGEAGSQILKTATIPEPEPNPVVSPQASRVEVPAAVRGEAEIPNQTLPWYSVFPRYIKMGFLHIVPQGLDHILFVLGLFLLSTRMKDLLKQITAFTVAHSLTLALSLYGVVRLPSSVVEPIIALSIVFVAVENLFTTKMHRWRIGVVFLFGLVHGLGFASALKDLGLAQRDFLTALVGFNCGVELGQLSVVAAAFLLVGWFRSNARYRSMVTVPASLAIALIAAVWTVERIL